jgi:hypothetical protein
MLYVERLYSLKSILPRGSGIWQNGRILFEMPCQTGSNSQNIVAILPRNRSFGAWVPKLSFWNQEKKSNGRSRLDSWLFCVAMDV